MSRPNRPFHAYLLKHAYGVFEPAKPTRGVWEILYSPPDNPFQLEVAVYPSLVGGRLEVSRLFVSYGQYHKGIGRAVVRALQEFCRDEGFLCIKLNTTLPETEGFWRKMGFAIDEYGDWKWRVASD